MDIDQLIKKYLRKKTVEEANLSSNQDCPSELELSDYLDNRLSEARQNLLLKHLADCRHCLTLLALAQEAKEKSLDQPSDQMIRQAKKIGKASSQKKLFNYKWQCLAAISFLLSFLFTQYFLQFLILAVIFSIKWIFDSGSTRTLIMIYEAWRKKDSQATQRIIQDLPDRIEQRR